MIYILDNAWPILAAALASVAFGFAWFGTLARNPAVARPTLPHAVLCFVAEAWLASILAGALILAPPEAGEWVMAIGTPIVIWIGFVVPALLVTLRRLGTPSGPILGEAGHWLGVMLVQALVLQGIGLDPPAAP